MSAFLVAFLLVGLVVLLALLYGQERPPPMDAPMPHEARLEQCVRALSDPAERAGAQRRLLSMGGGAVSPLLRCLERVDLHPLAFSAEQQAEVEAILADLGPQTVTQALRLYQRAHRHTATYPALLRVLGAHAPAALLSVANAAAPLTPMPVGALSFLASRLEPQALLGSLRQHDPLWTVEGVTRVAASLLPTLHAADAPFKLALADCAPNLWQRLQDFERQWLPIGLQAVSAPPSPSLSSPLAPIEQAIASLDLALTQSADLTALGAVVPWLDDPRVQERLIRLIQGGAALGPWAFAHLARRRVRGLQPLLNTLLRQPLDAAQRLSLKQAVVAYPEPCTQTLSLLLLSDHPLHALQAAEILSARADDPATLRLLVKAAHRHRHTALEAHLVGALLARPWAARHGALRACLADDDHEVQAAALELLGLHGDAEDADAIGRLLLGASPHRSAWGAAMSALEVLASRLPVGALASVEVLRGTLPEVPARPHLRRLLGLVEALQRPRGRC